MKFFSTLFSISSVSAYFASFLFVASLVAPIAARAERNGLPELRDASDSTLQAGMERIVRDLDLDDDVRAGRLALALVDVSRADAPRLAMLNGDAMMSAQPVRVSRSRGALAEVAATAHRAGRQAARRDDEHDRLLQQRGRDAGARVGRRRATAADPAVAALSLLRGRGQGRPVGRESLRPAGGVPARSCPQPVSRRHGVPGRAAVLPPRERRTLFAAVERADEGERSRTRESGTSSCAASRADRAPGSSGSPGPGGTFTRTAHWSNTASTATSSSGSPSIRRAATGSCGWLRR